MTTRITLAVASMMAIARAASAQVACNTLPNPVYLQIGDTQEPLIKALGKKLRDAPAGAMTFIYITSGSCTNIDAVYNNTPITVNPKYIPSATELPSWDPSMASPTCTIDVGGHAIDLGNSNVLVDACTQTSPPSGIGTFQGPIQAYLFAVPKASSQTAIVAEEAYFVFGFGQSGMILPWLDETFYFIRPITKSTLVSMAFNVGVPPNKWKGVQEPASSDVVNALVNSTQPEKSIGILGAEIYDANRSTLTSLAYRAYKQYRAYWPDSTATATDKVNVRDGHYTIWSPTVYLTAVDTSGTPTNANVAAIMNYILGKMNLPDLAATNPLDIVIAKGLVPQCAMKVTRSSEGGNLSLYSDPAPCGCYFESKTGGTTCTACSSTSPCASGVCRLGYCEAR